MSNLEKTFEYLPYGPTYVIYGTISNFYCEISLSAFCIRIVIYVDKKPMKHIVI